MYGCCIFDLDGTLLNTIHALTYTTNQVLGRLGLAQVDEAHMKVFVGNGYKKQMERSLLYAGDKELKHFEESLSIYKEEFAKHCMYQVEPYEGIRQLLTWLKEKNVKIGVLTNKPHQRAVENIEGIFGKGYFDFIQGEQEGIPKKPDPTGLLAMIKSMGARPKDCLYFGDTNTDMETGRAGGADTAGVLWGFRSKEELEAFHPKYLLNKPEELIRILEGGQ